MLACSAHHIQNTVTYSTNQHCVQMNCLMILNIKCHALTPETEHRRSSSICWHSGSLDENVNKIVFLHICMQNWIIVYEDPLLTDWQFKFPLCTCMFVSSIVHPDYIFFHMGREKQQLPYHGVVSL